MSLDSTQTIPDMFNNLITTTSLLLTIPNRETQSKLKEILDELQALDSEYKSSSKKSEKYYIGIFEKHYPIVLGFCKILLTSIYEKMTQRNGDFLPPYPPRAKFDEVYDKLLSQELEPYSERNIKERGKNMNVMMGFYETLLLTYTLYVINDICQVKNERLGPDIPLVVFITFPNNYVNQLDYEESIERNDFRFGRDLYIKLREFPFTFFESYPYTQEYLEVFPGVKKTYDDAVAFGKAQASPLPELLIKQMVEITLSLSKGIWRTDKKYIQQRFNEVLQVLIPRNYLLNSQEEWEEIRANIYDTKLTIEQLQIIMRCKIGEYTNLYKDSFQYSLARREKDMAIIENQLLTLQKEYKKASKSEKKKLEMKIREYELTIPNMRRAITKQRFPYKELVRIAKKQALKCIEEKLAVKGGGQRSRGKRRTKRLRERISKRKTRGRHRQTS